MKTNRISHSGLKLLFFATAILSLLLMTAPVSAGEKFSVICESPTEEQTITLNALAKSVGTDYSRETCTKLYDILVSQKELYVDESDVHDLTPLSELKQLEKLSLDNNGIGDLSPLIELTNLKKLFLVGNRIEDLTPLSGMKKLVYLYLDDNRIEDISPLRRLPNLQYLFIAYNRIKDVSPLSRSYKLTWLIANHNQIEDVSPLRRLKYIKRLNLSRNPVKNAWSISKFRNFKKFVLPKNVDLKPTKKDLQRQERLKAESKAKKKLADSTKIVTKSGIETDEKAKARDFLDSKADLSKGSSEQLAVSKSETKSSQKLDKPDLKGRTKDNILDSDIANKTEQMQVNKKTKQPQKVYHRGKEDASRIARKKTEAGTAKQQIVTASKSETKSRQKSDRDSVQTDELLKNQGLSDKESGQSDIDMGETVASIQDGTGVDTTDQKRPMPEYRIRPYPQLCKAPTGDQAYTLDVLAAKVGTFYSSDNCIELYKRLNKLLMLIIQGKNLRDISPLETLTNINWLFLYNNQITDISPLKRFRSLKSLGLDNNRIEDISVLKELTGLSTLSLHNNRIKDVSPLKTLKNLTSLSLHNNEIQDISPLSELSGLTSLKLNNNQIADIAPLSELTELIELHLKRNQISSITSLQGMVNLKKLDLRYNNISDFSTIQNHLNYERFLIEQ